MKLKDVFEKSVQFFKDKKIETARLDAEILIGHALKADRLHIYMKYEQPLSEAEVSACREVVRRRSLGEPVAYITGDKGFYGQIFKVGEGVLIPRPETELIVEEALAFIKAKGLSQPKILDLGAGTGCIGFSILKNCSGAMLTSVEKSDLAFKYLALNQESLGLTESSKLILGDVMAYDIKDQFDIIVANPPYIAEGDPETEASVKKYEPAGALYAAHQGYSALMDWSNKFKNNLKNPGIMLFEMGYQQGAQLKQHFEGFKTFSEVKVLKDLSGLDRTIKAMNN
jgi:release factor glutamine methyltransferase